MVSSTERPTGRSLTVICLYEGRYVSDEVLKRGAEVFGPEDALRVDDEEATKSDAFLLNEDPIVAGNLLVLVCDQG